MIDDEVRARLLSEIAALALERDERPVFVVDADGEIVWAGPAATRQIGATGLDVATRRMLARLAMNRSTSMLRLRVGRTGWFTPASFMARPLAIDGAPPLLALEATVPLAAERPGRDVAAEEGATPSETASFAGQPSSAPAEDPETAAQDALPDLPSAETPFDDEPAEAASAEAAADDAYPPVAENVRFIFEINQDGRVAYLSPDLEKAVGQSAASAVGKTWEALAAEHGLDPLGRVAQALKGVGGWSEITIGWPAEDGRRLGFVLSALPMFDRGRTLVGFRGLGRSAPSEGVDVADYAPQDETPVGAAGDPIPDAAVETDPELEVAEASDSLDAATLDEPERSRDEQPLWAFAMRSEPPAIVSAPIAPESFSGNVVPLRDPGPRPAGLTSIEESAFDEIARRLADGASQGAAVVSLPEAARPDNVETPDDDAIPDAENAAAIVATNPADDFSRLLDRMPIGAVVLRSGAIDYANKAALEMLGHRDLASLSARGPEKLFAEPIARDDAAPATVRLVSDDGVEVEAEARLSSIGWRGAPATLVSLKRAEGAVANALSALERERETAAILEAAADGVITLDGAGRILSINRGAEALFGLEGRDVVGSLFTLSLAPESRKLAFDSLDRQKVTGAGPTARDSFEVLGLSRHGGAVPLHMTLGRFGSANGADRFCAVLRDVTPWKRDEEELIAAKRQAERANAQKSDFLAKVGREIRTPLNAIIGFSEVMMEERFGPIGSPRYKDYLRDIHVSGGHLISLVNDLLDITRVESGAMTLDFAPVDLNEIAAQAAALLQPQASRDHVIIRTSLARAMPPVLADRRSIRQIMTNLASNAVRFSRPGGQVIVATAMTDIGQAVIRVRDAGAGMTKQELARAFEPFRPLADNDAGGGLGLPLTKALAEANEAALALQSELGRGTLAEVTFPASRVLAN